MNLQAAIGFHENPSSKDQEEIGVRELDDHQNREEVVVFDFDGVLSQSKGPYARGHFGPPIKKGIQLLRLVISKGYRPVILTARKETDLVHNFLAKLGFSGIMVTNHKVAAVAYIDDRAFNFDEDSSSVLDLFKKIEKKAGKK
jgi:hypothetical protein